MRATRRSITVLLGIACAGLTLFYPATAGSLNGVARADDNVRIESPADGALVLQ